MECDLSINTKHKVKSKSKYLMSIMLGIRRNSKLAHQPQQTPN